MFSGEHSRPFWNWINCREGMVWEICYSVGVYLQNIELYFDNRRTSE
jgi:hypothetical protein